MLMFFLVLAILMMGMIQRFMSPYVYKYLKLIEYIIYSNGSFVGKFKFYDRSSYGSSYTITEDHRHYSKSTKVYITVKDEDGNLYDDESIKLGIIHELSHIISDTREHTDEFYNIEKTLKDRAIVKGYLNSKARCDSSYPCINK